MLWLCWAGPGWCGGCSRVPGVWGPSTAPDTAAGELVCRGKTETERETEWLDECTIACCWSKILLKSTWGIGQADGRLLIHFSWLNLYGDLNQYNLVTNQFTAICNLKSKLGRFLKGKFLLKHSLNQLLVIHLTFLPQVIQWYFLFSHAQITGWTQMSSYLYDFTPTPTIATNIQLFLAGSS